MSRRRHDSLLEFPRHRPWSSFHPRQQFVFIAQPCRWLPAFITARGSEYHSQFSHRRCVTALAAGASDSMIRIMGIMIASIDTYVSPTTKCLVFSTICLRQSLTKLGNQIGVVFSFFSLYLFVLESFQKSYGG